MALPGDGRLVIDIPPVHAIERRGVLTIGFLDEKGEIDPEASRVITLTPSEELLITALMVGINERCGPPSSWS